MDRSLQLAPRRSLLECSNQYPPMMGVPELRQAVARHSQRHAGVAVDWQREVLVTVGATEALAAAFLGLLNQGDEVGCQGGRPSHACWTPMRRILDSCLPAPPAPHTAAARPAQSSVCRAVSCLAVPYRAVKA